MEERVWSRETEVQKSPGAEEPKHQGVQGLPLWRQAAWRRQCPWKNRNAAQGH